MRLGIGLTQRHQPELAQRVERIGFDSLWVGGHVLWHRPMLDPLTQLAAYAAVTETILLGTSVLVLPLYPPALIAKSTVTVDVISGGRTVLGVGVGGENPAEFELMGVPVGERGARSTEAIRLIRALWSGTPVEHAGRYYEVPTVAMSPLPAQAGGIPIWVGGRSPAALRRAAAHGDGWLGIFLSPERYAVALGELREQRAALGRDTAELRAAHYLWVRVGSSDAKALADAREYLQSSYSRSFTDVQVRDFCVTGTAEHVRQQLDLYERAGCEHVILKSACPGEALAEHVEVLGRLLH